MNVFTLSIAMVTKEARFLNASVDAVPKNVTKMPLKGIFVWRAHLTRLLHIRQLSNYFKKDGERALD